MRGRFIYLFLENCLEVVCGAGHTLSLEKFEDKMTIFISENKIKSSLRFLVTSCLKNVSDLLKIL